MNKNFIKYKLPFICWAFIIFVLCSTPGNRIPKISWLELLSFDKLVHASIFFVLILLSLRAYQNKLITLRYLILFICIAYGGALEIMQSLLFYKRSGDIFDFIANSFGCIIGYFLFEKIKKRIPELFI